MIKKVVLLLVTFTTFLIFYAILNFNKSLPMEIEKNDQTITVNLQLLGEYQTNIKSIVIRERSNKEAVYHVEAINKSEPIHVFHLRLGENPDFPRGLDSKYFKKISNHNKGFFLEKGIEYEISVSDKEGKSKTRKFSF